MPDEAALGLGDRRIAVWLALLTFVTYAWFFAGGGWNQSSQFDLTRAIVEQHTFAIDAYAGNTGDLARVGGHLYSNKSPALSWLAAIPYAPLYAIEHARGIDPSDVLVLTFNAYLCTLVCVALPGALVPAMLFTWARRRGFDAAWSVIVALAVALATQLLPYATLFMLHVPSGALMLYAFTSRRRAVAGFAAALATAINYLCAPALLAFAFLRHDRRPLPAVRYILGALPPLIALAIYQQLCFGNLFAISITREDSRFLTHGAAMGVFQPPSLGVLYAVTVSAYRGLFFFAPVLIMAVGGAILWFRSRLECGELAAIVFVVAVFFGFNICFNGWDGGFGVGGRYLVPLIPLFGMAMLHCRGWLRPMLVVLALISFAINFAATAVDPQPSASIPRPLTQYIAPLLVTGHFSPEVPITPPWSASTFTGHTSVNRMTMDEAVVFARHPPGSDASEWASFNLGEATFGAGNALSLLPIVAVLAGAIALILRRARQS